MILFRCILGLRVEFEEFARESSFWLMFLGGNRVFLLFVRMVDFRFDFS